MEFHSWHNLHLESPIHPFSLAIIIFFFFTIPVTVQTSLENNTFSFPRFGTDMLDIKFEGDAYVSSPIIILTKDLEDILSSDIGSVGRATYGKPLHLWDRVSGNLADFTTHFSFVIDSQGNDAKGNGFAFFLAPNGSKIQSGGPNLGFSGDQKSNIVPPKFVAVEFDTARTIQWDPTDKQEHIGIDLNSMLSVKTVAWSSNDINNGGRIDAWIYYNSSLKNLSVFVTNGDDTSSSNIHSYSLFYIVDLKDYLPEWVTFGFSASTTEEYFEKHEIYSWDFTSSLGLPEHVTSNVTPSVTSSVTPNVTSRERKSQGRIWVVLGIIGPVVLVLGLVFWFCCWMKRRRQREGKPAWRDDEFERVVGPRSFSYKELVVATNNFAKEGLLGRGGFGRVYMGFLRDRNSHVAIKKITSESQQGLKEYASEVQTISLLRHRNLVKLVGWCRKKQELLIVYEFMPNKSLDVHLFNRKICLLTWDKRYDVALGLASALFYLQEECELCVLHRDIKSSNVLLDVNFNAKLGDFGLARLVEHGQSSRTTIFMGTEGYVAPEYLQSSKATKESDIYSFGVVALEIACGKPAVHEADDRNGMRYKVKLVEWVWEHYERGDIFSAADPQLGQNYVEEEMERLIVVGLACAHPNHYDRPSIREAIDILNAKAPLPIMPSKMPLPANIAAHQANLFPAGSSFHGESDPEREQTQFSDTYSNHRCSNYYSATSNTTRVSSV